MKTKGNQGGVERKDEPDKWQEMNKNRKKPVFGNDSMNGARIGERGNDLCFSCGFNT